MNANSMGKSGFLYGILSCVMPCIPLLLLRADLREKHNIEGSIAGDAVTAFCCPNCVSCQIGNEIDYREEANEGQEMK